MLIGCILIRWYLKEGECFESICNGTHCKFSPSHFISWLPVDLFWNVLTVIFSQGSYLHVLHACNVCLLDKFTCQLCKFQGTIIIQSKGILFVTDTEIHWWKSWEEKTPSWSWPRANGRIAKTYGRTGHYRQGEVTQ